MTIRPDFGDNWFVTFENEEQCVDTATALIGLTFQGLHTVDAARTLYHAARLLSQHAAARITTQQAKQRSMHNNNTARNNNLSLNWLLCPRGAHANLRGCADKPIRCRVKTQNLVGSFNQPPGAIPQAWVNGAPSGTHYGYNQGAYNPYQGAYQYPYMGGQAYKGGRGARNQRPGQSAGELPTACP